MDTGTVLRNLLTLAVGGVAFAALRPSSQEPGHGEPDAAQPAEVVTAVEPTAGGVTAGRPGAR